MHEMKPRVDGNISELATGDMLKMIVVITWSVKTLGVVGRVKKSV